MTDAIAIRVATPEDAEAIAAIHVTARRLTMPWLRNPHTDEQTRSWTAGHVLPELEVLVAVEDCAVVGFVALGHDMLEHLYVHPEHQRRGAGGLLLEEAKRRRPRGLQLWVFQRNRPARGFYERRGFRLVELTDGSGNEEREPDARYAWP